MQREDLLNQLADWPTFSDVELRSLPEAQQFELLFPIAVSTPSKAPAHAAGVLLHRLNPKCGLSCREAITELFAGWDVSLEEVPWYLERQFGAETVLAACAELAGVGTTAAQQTVFDTVEYWVGLAPDLESGSPPVRMRFASKLPWITWKGPKGDQLDLQVEGYQFPAITEGYDANWLTVWIRASNEEGAWEASSACLLTWELRWMARWLSFISDKALDGSRLTGLENDLEWIWVAETGQGQRFAVCLRHSLSHAKTPGASSIVNLDLDTEQLRDAARFWVAASARFPPRGEQGRKGLGLPGPRPLLD